MNGGEAEAGITWGTYRWSMLVLAEIWEEIGQAGRARYLESLTAGIEDESQVLIPCQISSAEELDREWQAVYRPLLLAHVKCRGRRPELVKYLRIVGCYHAGVGYRTPFGEG